MTIGVLAILSMVMHGCGSGMKVSKADLKPLAAGFTGTFQVDPVPSKHRQKQDRNLLWIFEVPNMTGDTVNLSVDQQGKVTLHFMDGASRGIEQCNGRFSKHGYVEVFTRKEIKEVPPLVPIIRGSRQVNRIRMALSKDGSLVIDSKWENTANIFLMAGGGSGRAQYFFKAVK